MLMRTPTPVSPADAHSATTAPMTASVTPTRRPPKITGSGRDLEQPRSLCGASRRGCGTPHREGSVERMPTIVAIAIGKKTMSAQTTTRRRARRRTRCRAAARAPGSGSPAALDEALRQRDPDHDSNGRADDEAEDDLEQRHAHVRPEDTGTDGPDASLHHDLRCRKDVLRQVADDGHELPDREEDRQADDGRRDSIHAAPASEASDHGRSSSAWTDASASGPRPRACRGARVGGDHGARPREVDLHDSGDAPRPRGHDDDAIGEGDGLGDAVGDEDDGARPLEPEALELGVELLAGEGVERAERLVEQQHRGIADQRPSERGALRHPARKLARSQAPRPWPGRPARARLRRGRGARPARRRQAPSAAPRCR